MRSPDNSPAIEFRSVTKRFGDFIANEGVSFAISEGSVHGVVGENGAGKSTIMKILYGLYQPDEGSLSIFGQPTVIPNPERAISLGIGMVHQHFKLVPTLSVWENIILGQESGVWIRPAKIIAQLENLQQTYGFQLNLKAQACDLSVGLQQQLEILKLLYREARVLILDEPTAVLTPQEVDRLFEKLLGLQKSGRTLILITHKLREILQFTSKVTVMRQGKVIETRATAGLDEPKLAEMIVGRKIRELPARLVFPSPQNVLELKKVNLKRGGNTPLHEIDLTVRSGEIVGIAGISGNGQQELAEIVSGVERHYQGSSQLFGQELSSADIYALKQTSLSIVPPDRLREGLVSELPVEENLLLGHHRESRYRTGPLYQTEKLHQEMKPLLETYDIRPRSLSVPVGALSGGNQQKVIIARETRNQVRFLLAAYPTRGVDIGAIEFIHSLFLKARAEGAAILLISAELDEILALSDRIVVLYQGKIVGEVSSHEATERKLGLWMTGARA